MPSSDERYPRRPLLAQGERLKQPATRPRGPTNKFHPLTPEQAWAALHPQAERLIADVADAPEGALGRHILFEATLLPNYLAPSYFPGDVLNRNKLYVVGARPARGTKITAQKELPNQATRTLLLAGAPTAVQAFATEISRKPNARTERSWDEYRRFSEICLPKKQNVIVRRPDASEGDYVTFEAVLMHVFDSFDHEDTWANDHFQRFVDWANNRGAMVDEDYRRDLRGLTFVPVLARAGDLDDIADFNLLRAIRPMPQPTPFPDAVFRIAASAPAPSQAAEDGELPSGTIAVFDGGVDSTLPPFKPFVKTRDLTSEPPNRSALHHGSMVTSALLYGHVDPSQPRLPDPLTCVDHYRVFPLPPVEPGKPDHRIYEMLDQIVRTLRKTHYSIVALACGPDDALDDSAEPDLFTSELDALAHERAITFVTAVGNNGEHDSELGLNRVQPPGDMVNGIGVGACKRSVRHPKRRCDRAIYSARGPGREGQRVQPTVVEFGGSAEEPFVGFDAQGRLANSMGTSFAGPSAARHISGLSNRLTSSRHRPDVFRAFTVHFAEQARGHSKRFLELGYGRISNGFDDVFECAENEVTVLYEDELARGESIALAFPFPRGLAPAERCEIRWTLSYVTDVDPRDPTDYTLAGVEAIFRPDSRIHSLTDPKTKRTRYVTVNADSAMVASCLAQGHTLSDEPRAHSQWVSTRGEQQLRREGKWETLLPGRVSMFSEALHEPRVDLQYLRRAEGQLVRGPAVRPLRFAMLLSIRALSGAPIYDRVRSQYRVLAPLVAVPIRLGGVAGRSSGRIPGE